MGSRPLREGARQENMQMTTNLDGGVCKWTRRTKVSPDRGVCKWEPSLVPFFVPRKVPLDQAFPALEMCETTFSKKMCTIRWVPKKSAEDSGMTRQEKTAGGRRPAPPTTTTTTATTTIVTTRKPGNANSVTSRAAAAGFLGWRSQRTATNSIDYRHLDGLSITASFPASLLALSCLPSTVDWFPRPLL